MLFVFRCKIEKATKMLRVVRLLFLSAWTAVLLCASVGRAEYTESLTLRAIPHTKNVLAHFHFATKEPSAVTNSASDRLFPKVLQQILTKYDAESLHLTFSLGKYSDARYGPAQGFESSAGFAHAPFGTRLQVRLNKRVSGDTIESEDIQQRWRGLTAELGGIFSASLNQMDDTVVAGMLPPTADLSVLGAFPLDEAGKNHSSASVLFLHAGLAREEICTENLTPWLKMLPCRSITGLGKLIDPIKYLSGEYLLLSMFAARSSSSGEWTLHQHLTTVQTLSVAESKKWSLRSIFFKSQPPDQEELQACPLAKESTIYTEVPSEGYHVQQPPDSTLSYNGKSEPSETFGAPVVHVTSLKNKHISLADPWLERSDSEVPQSRAKKSQSRDVVTVHRFMTGYGQVHGGIAVRLENNHPQCAMRVTYHDIVPWYLRLYFNTFQVKVIGGAADEAGKLVQDFQFVPADLRGRPNQLHLEIRLPANSSLVFSIQLEKAFLRLSEHPPDANRGFDVPSGVATFKPIADQTACEQLREDSRVFTRTLFTEPLLVPLPTPDFSMPYNVITMTSTVVAFFVGSMLNTLLRKAPRIKQMMAKESTKTA